jgi:thiol-disulfide isomerase/thioredoxin
MADTKTMNKTGLIIGLAGALVVVLLIVAVVFGNSEVGAEYGTPTIEGQNLPLMPPNQTIDTSANGSAYPDVTGQDFDGSTVEIRNDDGRAKGIVFLAHWCPHCQAEVPRVVDWLAQTGGVEGVDLYSVATSMNSAQDNYPPSDWLDRENWDLPVIRDDEENSVLIAYGAGGFPYWVFTNADGTVALRTSGELDSAQLENILNSLQQ